ncbi:MULTISPECIES: hypothetical protein, partial [Bacteroides]|uniref:hypothetical protein n=1 Tax=Bacteroides TaxID=816 RepID=UPI00195CC316
APVLRQIARYLPHHRSENASKTHPKSSHDKFKTASYKCSLYVLKWKFCLFETVLPFALVKATPYPHPF